MFTEGMQSLSAAYNCRTGHYLLKLIEVLGGVNTSTDEVQWADQYNNCCVFPNFGTEPNFGTDEHHDLADNPLLVMHFETFHSRFPDRLVLEEISLIFFLMKFCVTLQLTMKMSTVAKELDQNNYQSTLFKRIMNILFTAGLDTFNHWFESELTIDLFPTTTGILKKAAEEGIKLKPKDAKSSLVAIIGMRIMVMLPTWITDMLEDEQMLALCKTSIKDKGLTVKLNTGKVKNCLWTPAVARWSYAAEDFRQFHEDEINKYYHLHILAHLLPSIRMSIGNRMKGGKGKNIIRIDQMQKSLTEKTFKVLHDIMVAPDEKSPNPLKTILEVFIAEVNNLSWGTKDSFQCMSNTIIISKVDATIKKSKKRKQDSSNAHAQATQSTGTSAGGNAGGNETTDNGQHVFFVDDFFKGFRDDFGQEMVGVWAEVATHYETYIRRKISNAQGGGVSIVLTTNQPTRVSGVKGVPIGFTTTGSQSKKGNPDASDASANQSNGSVHESSDSDSDSGSGSGSGSSSDEDESKKRRDDKIKEAEEAADKVAADEAGGGTG